MHCSACDHANPDSSRFCNQCGAPLASDCTACGRANPPASRFCNGCGNDLSAPAVAADSASVRDPREYTPRHLADKILRQKAALEGERKHVTVLFADLVDSTAFSASVDPEQMHSLMDRAFAVILEQVHRYEGTVNQFTGDGVMALFGAPIALEDAPRRAVLAALTIQRALEALDADVLRQHGRRFQMRIGIHSGPVVVGKIGDDLRMDYTAVGDTTNLAARLEQLAEPGKVVISDTTRRLVEGFYDFEPLEPTIVKGKLEPVRAYRVVAERAVSGRIEGLSDAQLTQYSGRESELETLMKAMENATHGRGQVAFIVGDAGIGKSRLLYEFRRRLQTVPHTWMEGHCASYARSTPFYAISDAVRRRLEIEDRDDEVAALQKLDDMEIDLGGDLDWTLPYVRRLLSLPSGDANVEAMDALTRRGESCRALHARFLRLSQRQPLVVVIEDLHWIDTASEEFLGFLAESIPGTPILLIFTHRPGYQPSFGDRSYHVRVPLQALSDDAMRAMARSVLNAQDLPAPLHDLIARKAEGNPLFVEEVIRSLLEEGAVRHENGKLTLARDIETITVPDRIQDVLMARLDRLEEGPKRAIQIASVIGREFALRLLERISEAGQGIGEIVGELRSLELIYEKVAHPELAYMFKHALTHDVAYDSVLVARRRVLHRIVGSAIEELYRDRVSEHYEALAHHFGEGEDWERALQYHELAAEKSAAAYANHAAAEHCYKGLAIAERLGDAVSIERRCTLASRLGSSRWLTSDFGASATAFLLASQFAPDPAHSALYLARASFAQLWNHDYLNCQQSSESARGLARDCGAEAAEAFATMSRDEYDLVHGRNQHDESHVESIVAKAERSGDASVLIACLSHMGQRAEWRGDYRRAIALCGRATKIAGEQRLLSEALFGQWFLGIAHVSIGEYGRGFEILGAGLELCERVGDRAVAARLLNTLGWAHAETANHVRAAEYNRMGTQLAREMVELGLVPGAPELYANAAINLAGSLVALGDLDAATAQLAPIRASLESTDDAWMCWRYSLHLLDAEARIELARGEPERALLLVERELAQAGESVAPKIEARARELQGRALLAMDRRDESAPVLHAALKVAQRIGYPPAAWRSLALLGEIARRGGASDQADQYFAQTSALVDQKAESIGEPEHRRALQTLGRQLAADPLATLR